MLSNGHRFKVYTQRYARSQGIGSHFLLVVHTFMESAGVSSAKTWHFNPLSKSQLFIYWHQIWHGWLVHQGQQPCKIWFRSVSGGDSRWWWYIRVLWLNFGFNLVFVFIVSSRRVQPKPVNRLSRTMAQKTRYDDRKCPLSERYRHSQLLGSFPPHTTKFSQPVGELKWKDRVTWKRLEMGKTCQCSMNRKSRSPFQNLTILTT